MWNSALSGVCPCELCASVLEWHTVSIAMPERACASTTMVRKEGACEKRSLSSLTRSTRPHGWQIAANRPPHREPPPRGTHLGSARAHLTPQAPQQTHRRAQSWGVQQELEATSPVAADRTISDYMNGARRTNPSPPGMCTDVSLAVDDSSFLLLLLSSSTIHTPLYYLQSSCTPRARQARRVASAAHPRRLARHVRASRLSATHFRSCRRATMPSARHQSRLT